MPIHLSRWDLTYSRFKGKDMRELASLDMRNRKVLFVVLLLLHVVPSPVAGKTDRKESDDKGPLTLEKVSLGGLAFRSIGPAVTGGRVIDIEVNPQDPCEYYVASAHGSQ